MKRIACLSTISEQPEQGNASAQLVDIYNSTRIFNREHDVTGVFLVCQKHVLQIIEGDGKALANLIYRFGRDSRCQDLSIICNQQASSSQFQGWTIRFIGQGGNNHSAFLQKLENILGSDVDCKSAHDRERFNLFFSSAFSGTQARPADPSESAVAVPDVKPGAPANVVPLERQGARNAYQKSVISLVRWPKPSQLKLTHDMIKLCSRLVGKPVLYERLCATGICQSESTLLQYLSSLDRLGLLRTHAEAEPAWSCQAVPAVTQAEGSADRFSKVLRRFLLAAKA